MASSTYEHLFKSVTLKYLLLHATSSNFPLRTLYSTADAAILLASVANTSSSQGSGIVNLKFMVHNSFANCQASSSISPHFHSLVLSK